MASPYSGVTITGYNSNPPADDGSQTEANRVKWSTIKTKITDPVKDRTDSMNTALIAAFGKVDAGITSTGVNYTVLSTDQGKLVRATASGITITTPDATSVGSPFVFAVLNDSAGDITLDGSSSQTIDGDAAITIPSGAGCRVRTDGSNWYTDGQSFQRTQVTPQGYLTLISEAVSTFSPFPQSDQSAATAVYYRPDVGNLIPIPDGTNFNVREFSELTLTLNSNHTANNVYDCFVWSDGGTLRLGTGPAWSSAAAGSSTRGSGAGTTQLQRLKGLAVNAVSITLRNGATTYSVDARNAIYVGSIFMDGTNGQVTCHVTFGQNRKWGVWNAYNKREIILKAGDSTASWTYGTATIRASNGASANKATVFAGHADSYLKATFKQKWGYAGASSTQAQFGIGLNSTTSISGFGPESSTNNVAGGTNHSLGVTHQAEYLAPLPVGINDLQSLEKGTTGTTTFYGTETNMLLAVSWFG